MLRPGPYVLPDVFDLAVFVQPGRPELAPDAGLLEATPLRLRDVGVVVVDPDRPVAQPLRDPLGPAGVLRPDGSGEAVHGVVGDAHGVVLAGERLDREHRPEG